MPKVYVKRFTDNGAPKALPAIVITAGNKRSVAVPFPTEGYLTRLVIKQTDGTPVAYDVELLDSELPYPEGESLVADPAADDVELYRIIPQQNVGIPGDVLEITNKEHGYPFHNQDGTFTDNQRKIYLVIIPDSAVDDTTWDVSLTAHTEAWG